MPVLPGEVLISRTAVMAPASRDGEKPVKSLTGARFQP